MKHYCCHRVYFTKTRGERDSDSVEFSHIILHSPYNSSSENFIIAAHELANSLKNPAPQAPFSNINNSQIVAIEQLSQIFSKVSDNVKKRVDPPQQQIVKNPPLYLIKCSPLGPNLFPQYIPIPYNMMRGRPLQVFSTSSICPLQVQELFPLKSLSHHQGRRLRNLQGWTRKGQVPT